jgi:hypothetical protein
VEIRRRFAKEMRGAHTMADSTSPTAAAAGTIGIGGDLTVNRLGFGAMRVTGRGIWGEPPDRDEAKAVLRRVVVLSTSSTPPTPTVPKSARR